MRRAAFAYIYILVGVALYFPLLVYHGGFSIRLMAAFAGFTASHLLISRSLFEGSRAARRWMLLASIAFALIQGYFVVRVAPMVWERGLKGNLTIFSSISVLVILFMFMFIGYALAARWLVYRPGPSS